MFDLLTDLWRQAGNLNLIAISRRGKAGRREENS